MGKRGTFKVSGIPLLIDQPTYGQAFFVNNADVSSFPDTETGVDSTDYGSTPWKPFSTLTYALSKCVASRGDTIHVMPGHAENVASASALAINKIGATLKAYGPGTLRPTLTLTAAASTIAMSAANCTLDGFILVGGFADVAVGIITSAVGCIINGNKFTESDTDLNYKSCIATDDVANSSDGLIITNNRRLSIDAAAEAFISLLEDQTDVIIQHNFDNQSSAADIGHFLIQGAFDVLSLDCQHNILNLNGDNNAQTVGVFATGSSTDCTGVMANNKVGNLDATTELFDTATLDYHHFNNLMTGTIAKSGYVLPAIDS